MPGKSNLVFVCQHGAAKSMIAAAYFNKLAGEDGWDMQAIARGLDPELSLLANAVTGLRQDGLSSTERIPQKLTLQELKTAARVISFCELPKEFQGDTTVEVWDDVPAVSEDYEKARDAIAARLRAMMKQLKKPNKLYNQADC